MDIRELLATRSLHDAILHLHERIEALEQAATKPQEPVVETPQPAEEEVEANG